MSVIDYPEADSSGPDAATESDTPTRSRIWGKAPLTMLLTTTPDYQYIFEGDLVPDNADPADLKRCLDEGYLEERTPDGFPVTREPAED